MTVEDAKRAFKTDKQSRKHERLSREASPVKEVFKPLPTEMKQDPEFLKNMVKFYGDEDLVKMMMAE